MRLCFPVNSVTQSCLYACAVPLQAGNCCIPWNWYQPFVSHHVGSGNQIRVPCYSIKCSSLLSCPLSPGSLLALPWEPLGDVENLLPLFVVDIHALMGCAQVGCAIVHVAMSLSLPSFRWSFWSLLIAGFPASGDSPSSALWLCAETTGAICCLLSLR